MSSDSIIDLKFEGIEEFSKALDKFDEQTVEICTKEMDESLEHLLSVAQKLSPKLVGDLEASGDKEDVKVDYVTKEISGEIGFRGLPYIVRMHEDVYNPGPITRGKPPVDGMMPGRKFLEQPLVRYMGDYIKQWAEAVRRVLE